MLALVDERCIDVLNYIESNGIRLYIICVMVAGNIEERIKKMKDAILTEAKQRAHSIVENAN